MFIHRSFFLSTNIQTKNITNNMNLYTITKDDLVNNYSLYNKLLYYMEIVDNKKPDGTCCGRGKNEAINKFIDNREKYAKAIDAIKNRKIKPKFSGVLYFTKVGKRFYADRLTDSDSLYLIENGYGNLFDVSEYENEKKQEQDLEPAKEEEPPKRTVVKTVRKSDKPKASRKRGKKSKK